MMNFAMMSFDVVPGVMVGVLGPVVGVITAAAFAGVAYGFAVLGYAALHRNDRPTAGNARVAPAAPASPAAWEMTPAIRQLLRSASDVSGARSERRLDVQRISSPRAAV